MLEYTLEDNELTKAEGDIRAQVVNVRSYTAGDIADRIMKIGAGLTRSDVASVLEAAKQVIADIIADGGAVHFDLFNAFPSIQGVFSGADDSFDPAKHRIKANLHAGAALREAVGKIRVKKVAAVLTGTVISSVTDIKTGSVNGALTPGKDAKLSGVKLRIAGEDASVGLYFVPADGEPVKVDASDLVVNNPGEIIAVIPALDAGTYRTRIITQFGSGGKNLKTPHSFTYSKDLTVS
ncbi:DNA-binding domain-containing protein [Treponema endosymbiont of Eucomonympha sp.]|uniref:HU family DNA-binding protein n=4 Tax=Treponema endosymbiont of Eucomonympha sp. TaxID=1580831 RepID=UPI0007508430|nr:DNA-binding domain-containing protein [Treponema endosymbiont of Eucomonympha sp.]